MNFDEAGVIEALTRIFGATHRGVEIGIGDDAAVVSTTDRTVITTDMAVEGTHFLTKWSSAFEIGRKITAANLADVYAMGGSPKYLVAAVTLTGQESMEWIEELAEGIAHEANSCGAFVVGGDLAKGPCIVISMTAIGEVDTPITRSGAQVGDSIYISSLPGWSAAGLSIIEKELEDDLAVHFHHWERMYYCFASNPVALQSQGMQDADFAEFAHFHCVGLCCCRPLHRRDPCHYCRRYWSHLRWRPCQL